MYVLKLNDETGQTQKWWTNFLLGAEPTIAIDPLFDIEAEFAKWGAEIVCGTTPYADSISFENEQDMIWFLLKWS